MHLQHPARLVAVRGRLMKAWFQSSAKLVLGQGVAAARRQDGPGQDYRAALCRWEDALFAAYPVGHQRMEYGDALALICDVFQSCGRPVPRLDLVSGFADPRVGGLADIAGNRILIETGCLYRFLVLHESAHLLVPEDRLHGPGFTYLVQYLYRACLGIPEGTVRALLARYGLPGHTALPDGAPLAAAA